MKYGIWLIDAAAKKCSPPSRYQLVKELRARQVLASESNLSRYAQKNGPPIEWIPSLAELAQVDPGQAVLRVLAERAGGKSHLGGMAAAIGGAATLLFSYSSSVFQTPGNLTIATAMFDWLRIVSRKRRPVYQGANPA